MNNQEIISLFKTDLGTQALRNGGDDFELSITLVNPTGSPTTATVLNDARKKGPEMKIKNIVDLGRINKDTLEFVREYVPYGYEGIEQQRGKHEIKMTFEFQYQNSSLSSKSNHTMENQSLDPALHGTDHNIIISSSTFYPQEKSESSKYSIRFNHNSSDTAELCPGSKISFEICIEITEDFEGQIAKWLLFRCKKIDRPSLTCKRESDFVLALQLKGSILSGTLISQLSRLSPHAADFVPLHFRRNLEMQCGNIITPYGLPPDVQSKYVLSVPNNYASIVDRVQDLYCPDGFLINNYYHGRVAASDVNFVDFYKHVKSDVAFSTSSKKVKDHLYTLLALNSAEEIQLITDIKKYDLYNQKLEFTRPQDGKSFIHGLARLSLTVKGLSESRPKLSVGDFVIIRPNAQDLYALSMTEYQGVIYKCSLKTETIECQVLISRYHNNTSIVEDKLADLNKVKYHIRFTFKREGFAFIERALRAACDNPTIVIPPMVSSNEYALVSNLQYVTQDSSSQLKDLFTTKDSLKWNAEQLYAIQAISSFMWKDLDMIESPLGRTLFSNAITNKEDMPVLSIHIPPFIIHGPPGTGKTSTLIEGIRQLKIIHPKKRLLVCAPSDTAADVLCYRLSKYFTKDQMHRLNWWQRIKDAVQPKELLAYCHLSNRDIFEIPTHIRSSAKDTLKSYDIIVTTCVCAGVLREIFDANSYFDAVIVDEVSQGTEGEIVVPLSLAVKKGIIVIAGDPKQLGAEMRSPLYRERRFNQSIQERLMELPMYNLCRPEALNKVKGSESSKSTSIFSYGIFLQKNYRSHHHMLKVPSKLFYSGAIDVCAGPSKVSKYLNWSMLPTKGSFPMLFIGVDGRHFNAIDSPSFNNYKEAEKVVEVVKSLLNDNIAVGIKDIGVIGGFRSQVLLIRNLLRVENLAGINVGGVEDYQGQEKNIIIISTVLSGRVPNFERNGSIGLFNDDRRFNVAVTRGVGLCIVIGHPTYLYSDRNWQEFIEYCDEHESYVGHPCRNLRRIVREREDENDLLNEAAQMALGEGFGEHDLDISYDYRNSRDAYWRVNL